MSIAKSNGLSLDIHSKIVSEISSILSNKIMLDNINIRFNETIKYASLLHDIGKLTTNFQKFLKGKLKKPNLKFRHNEIGWAIVSKYLSKDFNNRDIILNIIYWHHGISNQVAKFTDNEILNSLDKQSIDNMVDYLTTCVGEEYINQDAEYCDGVISPLFYPLIGDSLTYLILCRSIVTTSDRISSNLTETNQITNQLVDNYLNNINHNQTIKCKFEGTDRFNLQKDIINQSTKTTLIKAPAGFGKTMMGLLWGLKNDKKLLWVVPRNSIAESIYLSITEEFSNLQINPTIQLVLSGEVKKSNSNNFKLYDADVIVTNIDNFLAPSFKNDVMDCSSLILGCNVVFDEYHELITNAPLMTMFVNIMRIRHRLTTSNTLLLSATQFDCEFLWDNRNDKTTILPNANTHYPAVHNKKYLINVLTEQPNISINSSTLVVKNTIPSAQQEKLNNSYELLLHSNFIDEKKDSDFKKLLSDYSKKSKITSDKPNVIGTHIIQASLDISFNVLVEDVLSPQSTLQRIGRIDRFGNQIIQSTINIVKNNDRGNIKIKDMLYSRNLSDAWFDFILPYNKQELTLNELYLIFNEFNNHYSEGIKRFITTSFEVSNRHLSNIYPIKIDNKIKSDIKTSGSNKLRSVNNEIFYIVQHENGNDWVGPFTKQILKSFDEEFNEVGNPINRMLKTMTKLRNSNNENFDYNDILDQKKYVTIDKIRKLANKSNTPYIVYDRIYNDELGIININ